MTDQITVLSPRKQIDRRTTFLDVESQQQREPFLVRSGLELPSWWEGERDPRELRKYALLFFFLVLFAAAVLSIPIFLPPSDERAGTSTPSQAADSTHDSKGGPVAGGSDAHKGARGDDTTAASLVENFAPFGKSILARGERYGAVAADNPVCSKLGLQVLSELGGNAVDAAVTSALCQGVLSPFASGIGGGCFALVRLQNGSTDFIDARETAPMNLTHQLLRERGPESTRHGGLSIAVPGELRGLELIHALYGKLSWRDVVLPVIPLARNATVGTMLAYRLAQNAPTILKSPTLCEVFCDPSGSRVLAENETLVQTALAELLTQIALHGADHLYNHSASTLAKEIQEAGGLMTAEDISGYQPKRRQPLQSFYRGFEILGSSLPSSGGPAIAMALNILEGYNMPSRGHSNESLQLVTEALKYAFASRSQLGDPDFVPEAAVHVSDYMVNKAAAARLRETLDTLQTHPADYYFDAERIHSTIGGVDDHGTTHLSVLDAQGNAVALTSTINTEFGSMIRSRSTGIVFNNEIDDFSVAGHPNAFDISPSEPNFPVPGKRPLSSMSPTIVVRNGRTVLVVGGSGGPRIISSTLQVLINVLDFADGLVEAISMPRVHHQLLPNVLWMEAVGQKCELGGVRSAQEKNSGIWTQMCQYMRRVGHEIEGSQDHESIAPEMVGCVQAVVRPHAGLPLFALHSNEPVQRGTVQDGIMYAASDPRKRGQAAAA